MISTSAPARVIRSVIVVYWWDLMEAISVAKIFASSEKPYVRLDFSERDCRVTASAMTPFQLAAVDAEAKFIRLGHEDDRTLEIGVENIKRIEASFRLRRSKNIPIEDQPLIEIHMSAEQAFFFDASGLNLHLYKCYVDRNLDYEVPSTVPESISRVVDYPAAESSVLETRQLKNIISACAKLGERPNFEPFTPPQQGVVSTVVTRAGNLSVLSTVVEDGGIEERRGSPADDQPQLIAGNQQSGKEIATVETRPPWGIA